MAICNRIVEYSDGVNNYLGYLAWDNDLNGELPAVLVVHTAAGRKEFECARARRLAQLGYAGFAIDLYGDARQGNSPEESIALMEPLRSDRPELQRRLLLALETLQRQPEVDAGKIAAMGFCFGGLSVLDLARIGAGVRGVASFHGVFDPPGNTGGNTITARVLCLHGYDDPMAPPETVLALAKEMSEAGADWQIHAYGNTMHSYTNPEANNPERGTVYNEAADRRSWTSLVNFLDELFAPS